MRKTISLILSSCILILTLGGCSNNKSLENNQESKETTITIAAAASLKKCMEDKLIPMFNSKNPNIRIEGTYDSSGKLQTQIQQGANVDVFMSAATKQMDELKNQGLIQEDSIINLLENKIVLITPSNGNKEINTFEDILKSDKIAIGDPASVPAGQYAKQLFENLNIWDGVSLKTSLGTNVTEVLNWVAEGSADSGVVYSTDVASNNKVKVVAEAPEGKVSKVIYPVGITKDTKNQEGAKAFVNFLASEEAVKVFESYGFSSYK